EMRLADPRRADEEEARLAEAAFGLQEVVDVEARRVARPDQLVAGARGVVGDAEVGDLAVAVPFRDAGRRQQPGHHLRRAAGAGPRRPRPAVGADDPSPPPAPRAGVLLHLTGRHGPMVARGKASPPHAT